MLVDYHTHHERCGHAVGRLEEYIQAAVQRGLREIGLSDHQPVLHIAPEDLLPEVAMPLEELPLYVAEALALKEKYRGVIDVKVGLEADWVEGDGDRVAELLGKHPFDYVIGSVHFLGTWDHTDSRQLAGWDSRDILETYAEYFKQVRMAAQSGLFDTIGHIDVIKRFGYVPEQPYEHLLEETVDAVRAAGVCVEVNASGLRYPCAEQFPSRRMLEMLHAHRVPLTLGSDAHQPRFVGEGLDVVVGLLREVGYKQVHGFTGRQRYEIEI